jgi:hypothetical protein
MPLKQTMTLSMHGKQPPKRRPVKLRPTWQLLNNILQILLQKLPPLLEMKLLPVTISLLPSLLKKPDRKPPMN